MNGKYPVNPEVLRMYTPGPTIVAEMSRVTKGQWECWEPTGVLTCRTCATTWTPADGHRDPFCPHKELK